MRLLLILVLNFLLASTAHAELWVCQNGSSLKRLQGDGLRLGIATVNYTTINANCILATKVEYESAAMPNKKLDKTVVTGNRIVDMTPAEIAARDQAIADARAQAEAARLKALDDDIVLDRSTITLTKVDTAIDNIGSLADAKVFLKRLVRYIATRSGQ